jgi:hypothetical protein
MTKRGSLVYYLTAWVVGCITTATLIWLFPSHIPNGFSSYRPDNAVGRFLGLTMGSLMVGAIPALLFGWILRRVMTTFSTAGALSWILLGSLLSPSLIYLLGAGGEQLFLSGRPLSGVTRLPLIFVFSGPAVVFISGLAASVPAGGITAFVLFLVHRAFDPEKSAKG